MGKRKSAERRIDLARCNRLKLVQQRKLHPVDIDMELAPEMPDKWQGQFIETATEEADPQPVCLTKDGLPAIVQRGAEHQGSGFYAETKFLAKGRQLDAPARSDEQWPPTSFSKEFIASETEDWARDSLFAAFPKCRSVATARKQSICRSSTPILASTD